MIEELKRFLLAAKLGNISKAAEKSFITQSALTQSIDRLEKEIGSRVFVQRGRNLELTKDGKALVIMGGRILELWERAKETKARDEILPPLTIGMFDNAALRLAGFVQRLTPGEKFTIELKIDNSEKLLTSLQLGILDMALLVKSAAPSPKEIICLATFTEELIPVARKKFSTAIEEVPFILYNKGSHTREQIDEVFIKKGIKPKIYVDSTSVHFMKELALSGAGVALLPSNLIKEELNQKKLFRQNFNMKWTRQFGIYVQKNFYSEEIHLLVDEITKALK